jgi:hypothetical protein
LHAFSDRRSFSLTPYAGIAPFNIFWLPKQAFLFGKGLTDQVKKNGIQDGQNERILSLDAIEPILLKYRLFLRPII